MDLDRYYELRAILQQWKTRLAESIRRRVEAFERLLARLQNIYAGEGTDEAFALWLDRWCRQAAIQFILRVLFLRVLEDRGLLGVTRIRDTDGQRMWAQLARNLGAAQYVRWCCWDAAHLLPDLFGPTAYDLALPDDELAQRFLDDVWRRPDPNRPSWLRFDFRSLSPAPSPAGRGEGSTGDPGFRTRFIGDLYQELDAEIRERYALLQTPHFISQFILEHTLLKRFEERDFREVTLLDPTSGSGHFLVDAFWMFVERYEDVMREDVIREDVMREDVMHEGVIREDVMREDVMREDVMREDVMREDVMREGSRITNHESPPNDALKSRARSSRPTSTAATSTPMPRPWPAFGCCWRRASTRARPRCATFATCALTW